MSKSALFRNGPPVALAVITLAAGLVLAMPLTRPDAWPHDLPPSAAVSEARAVAAEAEPVDLAEMTLQTRRTLTERPTDATAWARLAWIAAEQDDMAAARDALDRSYVAAPYWAERLVKMRQIGTHIFYRWTGGWGLPGAFTGTHAGTEPVIAKLNAVATFVEDLTVPVVEDDLSTDLSITPMVTVTVPALDAPPSEVVDAPVEETAPPVEVVAAPPPPPPPVLASPLDASRGVTPQRRARIAVPR